jgi:gamma-glutamyltranspeptidase / glutathione hydrolase
MRHRSTVATLFLATAAVLLTSAPPADAQEPRQGPKPAATGERYMVSSSHPMVNEAMVEVLEAGGNAVDAMITAVLLQPVVEPHMSTIAGAPAGLIYMAETDELVYLDAELNLTREDRRLGITSGGRIGVPGTVRGLAEAAERYGTLEWAEYLEPAIRWPRTGSPCTPTSTTTSWKGGSAWRPTRSTGDLPPGRRGPGGGRDLPSARAGRHPPAPGREGPEYFYTGEWARTFVEKANDTGGNLDHPGGAGRVSGPLGGAGALRATGATPSPAPPRPPTPASSSG